MGVPQHVPHEAFRCREQDHRRWAVGHPTLLRGVAECQRHVVRRSQRQRYPRSQRVSQKVAYGVMLALMNFRKSLGLVVHNRVHRGEGFFSSLLTFADVGLFSPELFGVIDCRELCVCVGGWWTLVRCPSTPRDRRYNAPICPCMVTMSAPKKCSFPPPPPPPSLSI